MIYIGDIYQANPGKGRYGSFI